MSLSKHFTDAPYCDDFQFGTWSWTRLAFLQIKVLHTTLFGQTTISSFDLDENNDDDLDISYIFFRYTNAHISLRIFLPLR